MYSCSSEGGVSICRLCLGDDETHTQAYEKRATRKRKAAKQLRTRMPTSEET